MKYSRTDRENLRIELNFVVEKTDYEKALNKKLTEQQKNAQLKGFRKGKVPMSMIRKMYGNSILVDSINELLGKELDAWFERENLEYLGEPMLVEGHQPLDVNILEPADYSFTFDVGLKPTIDVKGVSPENEYERLVVEVDDRTIDSEMDVLRRRSGKQELVTDSIEVSDILTLEAIELEDGNPREKGWETAFTIMVETIDSEELKNQVLTLKQGDSFDFNIYTLEKGRDEKFVRKYFLNLDEEEEKEIGQEFRATIKEVRRLMPAEMDAAFFERNFGDEASDEAAARAYIQSQLGKFYENEAMQLVYHSIMESAMDETQVELPVSFLERWLRAQEQNKDLDEADFKSQFERFLKEMKWTLIKSFLSKQYEVKVEENDIQQRLYQKANSLINNQFSGMNDPGFFQQVYEYLAKDRQQVSQAAEEVMTDKIFDKLKDVVTLKDKSVSLEEFKEIVKSLNQHIAQEKND